MWEAIKGNLPSGAILFCAALSAAVPWTIYWINRKIHEYGDPPWMENSETPREGHGE